MTKQYHFGNVCGDKGLVAPNDEWVIENVNNITDLEKNWDTVLDLLNEQHEQIEDLKDANVRCCNEYSYFHKRMMELEKENEQLKSENNMLKVTIGRNEAYIKRLTETSEWHC